MSNEIKEKEEYEKYARDHRKELDAQEVKLGDVVKVLVGHFAGEKGVIVGMTACDKSDYADPYYEIEMECDVPEEFMVRKTLIGQSRVIGGVERRYLKVIGNRAPKQPSMEIKQGDKVRVSKDAPRIYQKGSIFNYTEHQSTVHEVDGDAAIIGLDIEDSPIYSAPIAIPCKYLVKVDAEAKEAKFKIGDKVFYVCSPTIKHKCTVTKVTQNEHSGKWEYNVLYDWGKPGMWIPESDLEPYTEPAEQTDAERTKKKGDTLTFPIAFDLADSYWDAYAADLAKEVALKVANKYNDPEQAAEYAVSVAKAVAEGLKRK